MHAWHATTPWSAAIALRLKESPCDQLRRLSIPPSLLNDVSQEGEAEDTESRAVSRRWNVTGDEYGICMNSCPPEDALYSLHQGDVLAAYTGWPTPVTIGSDGAYGVRGFHGDTTGPDGLVEWYRPHVENWSKAAHPSTTLWFWNTEVGWATVHPLLAEHGWEYVETVTWDKGLAHIAGNVNGKTIRRFPVVSEVCVLYQRRFELPGPDGSMPVQKWLRHEWVRSGLPLYKANEACGVKNAATRKYLTQDWLWY